MQWSSNKILTFEEFSLVNKEVAVAGTLTDKKVVECLAIYEDAPSEDKNDKDELVDIVPKEAKAAVCTLCISLEKKVMYKVMFSHHLF